MVKIETLTAEQAEAERREIASRLSESVGTADPAVLRENAMLGRYDDEVVRLVRRLATLDYLAAKAS
ncbi:hypothetical protein USB125703_00641 [Pseudoclavibacter triregionum]|nr:hypothetical protein USB125703_00641 [Pseudoclavibacter triregionum]